MKFLLIFFLNFFWIGNVMAIEEPKFEVLVTDGAYEIRKYAPYIVAETWVEGDMDEASSKGFRLIADYIFGNNQAVSSASNEKIAMTAPVTLEPQSAKIAMTAPVTLEPQTGAPSMETAKQWLVKFIMPSQYTLATIPKPKNTAVTLRETPSKQYAVLKYSGFNFQSRVQTKIEEALAWAAQRKLQVIGQPQLSRYDPPWTLPMLRRNEIMIEISNL
jgi:hypothetical protein